MFRSFLVMTLALIMSRDSRAAETVNLAGWVLDDQNVPIADATVYVRSCRPKKGDSFEPMLYPDWGKKAKTDEQGNFVIEGLDPEMLLRVVAVAQGRDLVESNRVDPARQKLTMRAKPLTDERREASHTIRGRVTDQNNQPLWGVEVEPYGMKGPRGRWWGSAEADAFTVTNAKGEFLITTKDPDVQVDLHLRGRGVAPQNMVLAPTGETVHEIQMAPGGTVTGRLLSEGNPVADAVVALAQAKREMETEMGPWMAYTDETGRFTFKNVPSGQEFKAYGAMRSLRELNMVIAIQQVAPVGDGESADVGEIQLARGFAIAGQIRTSDGKKIPGGAKVSIRRDEMWDRQEVNLDAQGLFKMVGVPNEAVWLRVDMRGYRPAGENVCFDIVNGSGLIGLVDQDIEDLVVLMEPGQSQHERNANRNEHGHQQHELKKVRLEGLTKEAQEELAKKPAGE